MTISTFLRDGKYVGIGARVGEKTDRKDIILDTGNNV